MNMLSNALRAHAARRTDHTAIDPVVGEPVSYASLQRRVAALAEDLRHSWDPARPAALQVDYGPETAITELAMLEAGIPVLSLPLFFTSDQSQHAISTCGAEAYFGSVPRDCSRPRKPAPSPLLAGTARTTFTSGSTGLPKGVCLSAEHMLGVAQAVVDAVGAQHAGRHLALLPPGILLETVAGFYATILAGGTYVCPPQKLSGLEDPFRPDFGKMLRGIAEWRITSLVLVPEYLAGLVHAMDRSGVRLPLLTLVAVGGAHTNPDLIAHARALGLPVRQGYGLTECASVVALEDNCQDPAGPVGRVLAHMQATIAEDGEILLDGPLCLGTLGEPRRPGPLATGDIGRIDEQGRLWVDGRKSNLIVTSFGRNISPEWVESVLLGQPAIAQAMVFGDGRPALEALLVPAAPDSDLEAALAAANALLPPYARIGAWREAAHFTPFNGRLTGNGRLRRKAIAAAYLGGEVEYFTELEAATTRERLRFLSVPQLQAGLKGTITRQAYIDYLTQAFHHVSHTVPLMRAARARLADRPTLVDALDEYIAEEEGHEEWILADISASGGDARQARLSTPAPATQAMVAHAYERIRTGNPIAFFGMVYVLESVSVALAQQGASAVARNLGLPPDAFTYLTSHGALDKSHMEYFARLVNGFTDPADRQAITDMANEIFRLFGRVFASVDLEATDVAA